MTWQCRPNTGRVARADTLAGLAVLVVRLRVGLVGKAVREVLRAAVLVALEVTAGGALLLRH